MSILSAGLTHYACRPTVNPAAPITTPTIITTARNLFRLIHCSTSDFDVASCSVLLLLCSWNAYFSATCSGFSLYGPITLSARIASAPLTARSSVHAKTVPEPVVTAAAVKSCLDIDEGGEEYARYPNVRIFVRVAGTATYCFTVRSIQLSESRLRTHLKASNILIAPLAHQCLFWSIEHSRKRRIRQSIRISFTSN